VYTKIDDLFWKDTKMKARSDDAKMVFFYLLTCPHRTMIGMFHLPIGYASADMGWKPERFTKGFEELFRNGFINRDLSAEVVLIKNYLKYNQIENPNQVKAAVSAIDKIAPNLCDADLTDILEGLYKPFMKPLLERLQKRYIKPETETETETETEYKMCVFENEEKPKKEQKTNTNADYSPEFELFWKAYPNQIEKVKAWKVWNTRICEKVGSEKLIHAAREYAKKCSREKTELKYIKHPSTFLGPLRPYEEFIRGGDEDYGQQGTAQRNCGYDTSTVLFKGEAGTGEESVDC